MRVTSRNNFPTGAGLASSASGFAALVRAAEAAFGLELAPRERSVVARFGSGSAARSVFGGFVEMHAGTAADGNDSFAEPLLDARRVAARGRHRRDGEGREGDRLAHAA